MAEPKKKPEKQEELPKEQGPFVYIGPTLKEGVFLERMSIVKDKSRYVEKRPEIERLFVRPSELAKARRELKRQGSELAKAYAQCAQKEAALRRGKR